MSRLILVTGVTGFLGKVVLEELLRCRPSSSSDTIVVLIRPKAEKSAEERFLNEVAGSLCFSRLPDTWTSDVNVVACDLSQRQCGMDPAVYTQLCLSTTHIIHCAGSVAFASAAEETVAGNITSTLNVLELARSSPNLLRFVSTSTAYVTPYANTPINEVLPPIPRSASDLYVLLQDDPGAAEDVLRSTGHPNLYTFAKCLTEHLLVERRGHVPLTIVRPSIISASWRYPFPGWVDSFAAFAGLVAGAGSGYLRVFNANPEAILDIVPVDDVARRLIEEAFIQPDTNQGLPHIVHVVSTAENGIKVSSARPIVVDYFTRHRVLRKPKLSFIGSKDSFRFQFHDILNHRLPLGLAKFVATVRGDAGQLRRIQRARKSQVVANTVFEPFTHRTYDFRSKRGSLGQGFDRDAYLLQICHGVRIYLFQRDPRQAVLAGKQARRAGEACTLRWARQQPDGKLSNSLAAVMLRKMFGRIFDNITFDEQSFVSATENLDNACVIIAPTHRSYLDSLVCSYLFFVRPELRIRLPRVAASQEFADIPVIGWLCRRLNALFVVRGLGKPDPRLDEQLRELVSNHENLMFFVEGQRSRTGQVLPAKRGMLRSLQASGAEFVILPVSISYDQVPEARAFARELQGGPRQLAQPESVARWIIKVLRGKVNLGRVHVQCGSPLRLDGSTDIHGLNDSLTAAFTANTVSTTFHLRSFVQHQCNIDGADFNVDWIRSQIEARGGHVLESSLSDDQIGSLERMTVKSFQKYWEHHFFRDLEAFRPHGPVESDCVSSQALREQVLRSTKKDMAEPELANKRLEALLSILLHPDATKPEG